MPENEELTESEELTALRAEVSALAKKLKQIQKTIPRDQIEERTPIMIQIIDLFFARVSNQFAFSLAAIAVLLAMLNFVEGDRLQQAIDLYRQINLVSPVDR